MIRESNFVLHELHLLNQMEETFYVSVFFKVTESVIVIHDSSSYWFVVEPPILNLVRTARLGLALKDRHEFLTFCSIPKLDHQHRIHLINPT